MSTNNGEHCCTLSYNERMITTTGAFGSTTTAERRSSKYLDTNPAGSDLTSAFVNCLSLTRSSPPSLVTPAGVIPAFRMPAFEIVYIDIIIISSSKISFMSNQMSAYNKLIN